MKVYTADPGACVYTAYSGFIMRRGSVETLLAFRTHEHATQAETGELADALAMRRRRRAGGSRLVRPLRRRRDWL